MSTAASSEPVSYPSVSTRTLAPAACSVAFRRGRQDKCPDLSLIANRMKKQ
jgi:hypothetical protein